MLEKTLFKPAVLMAVIVFTTVLVCELYLLNHGVGIAYDDEPPLWASKRAMVYESSDQAVVFIGSSRIKYDLDIPLWEKTTQTHAIQLAIEGSSPRPVFDDLTNDPNFKGRLIVDVTEGLFFSDAPPFIETPNKNIKYAKAQTPAQKASALLNTALESQLVLLDKNTLSLNAQLQALQLRSRKGIFMMPNFPMDFGYTTADRQAYMTQRFVADTNLQNQVGNIWRMIYPGLKHPPDEATNAVLTSVQSNVDKIKARGGDVLFVRTPANGFVRTSEDAEFPKAKYWDKLLAATNCKGIYYADYPAMAHFVCPEMSHLKPRDATAFTQALIDILKKEKGWKLQSLTANSQ